MKAKIYIFTISLFLVSGLAIIWVQSCRKTEQITDGKPDNNQLIVCYLYDNTTGKSLQDCNIDVISPQGQQELNHKSDSMVIKNIIEGQYTIKVWKENFISETKQVEVKQTECETCGSVYTLYFYLTKMSDPVKIGVNGGDITFQDGTRLHFPEGALNEEVEIIATQIPAPVHPNQIDFSRGRIPVMEINVQPEGLVLNKPVVLSVPLKFSKGDTSSISFLSVAYYDILASAWEGVKGGMLNKAKTRVEFQVEHFSTISVIPPYTVTAVGDPWWSEWKDEVYSSCGEAITNHLFKESYTLYGRCFFGGSFTVEISATLSCSAKADYKRHLFVRHKKQYYEIDSFGIVILGETVPVNPIDPKCEDVLCHQGGGSN